MPRFQFTIWSLLWTTFWLAATLGAWVQIAQPDGLSYPHLLIGDLAPLAAVLSFLGRSLGEIAVWMVVSFLLFNAGLFLLLLMASVR